MKLFEYDQLDTHWSSDNLRERQDNGKEKPSLMWRKEINKTTTRMIQKEMKGFIETRISLDDFRSAPTGI